MRLNWDIDILSKSPSNANLTNSELARPVSKTKRVISVPSETADVIFLYFVAKTGHFWQKQLW